MGNAGVIDQYINAAKTLDGQRHRPLNCRRIGHITEHTQGLSVVMIGQVLHQAVERLLLQIKDHQPCAGLCQAHGQRAANTGTAARNHHNFAVEYLVGEHLAVHNLSPTQ